MIDLNIGQIWLTILAIAGSGFCIFLFAVRTGRKIVWIWFVGAGVIVLASILPIVSAMTGASSDPSGLRAGYGIWLGLWTIVAIIAWSIAAVLALLFEPRKAQERQ